MSSKRIKEEEAPVLSEEGYGRLSYEIIRFLQKWGLWQDVIILTKGKMYSPDSAESVAGKKEAGVKCEEGVVHERYTTGTLNGRSLSFSNPEHLLDMVFEGGLQNVLRYNVYEACPQRIGREAWEVIFKETDLLKNYLIDRYDLAFPADLKYRLECQKDILNNDPELSQWDPLVFDTWEEYLDFSGGEEEGLKKGTELFDTYADYVRAREDGDLIDKVSDEEIRSAWEHLVDKAKTYFMTQVSEISLPEMSGVIKNEFDAIFDRYSLWYEFGFSWTLTCYRK